MRYSLSVTAAVGALWGGASVPRHARVHRRPGVDAPDHVPALLEALLLEGPSGGAPIGAVMPQQDELPLPRSGFELRRVDLVEGARHDDAHLRALRGRARVDELEALPGLEHADHLHRAHALDATGGVRVVE